MEEKLHYFAYGSNMSLPRLRKRVPRAEFLDSICVNGFTLVVNKRSIDGSAKCNLQTSADCHIWGVLYSIYSSDISLLDKAEGLGYGYNKEWIEISHRGAKLPIFFYIADSAHIREDMEPYDWYMQFVISGAEEHGFPEGYLHFLQQIPSKADPDQNRSWMNQQILAHVPPRVD